MVSIGFSFCWTTAQQSLFLAGVTGGVNSIDAVKIV
jgi:hypothetical protein